MKLKGIFWPLAMVMMLLCSCSKERSLLETVPDNVVAVVTVNIPDIAEEMGITMKNGEVVMPDSLRMGMTGISPDRLKMLAGLAEAVDMKHTVMFGDMKYQLITAEVKDAAKLGDILENEGAVTTSASGFTLYSIEGYTMAVRDAQLWINENKPEKAVDIINSALKKAADGAVGDNEGLTEFLTDDKLMAVGINNFTLGNINEGKESAKLNKWTCINADIKDNKIQGDITGLKSDGTLFETKGLADINLPVLGYVPDNDMMVMAIGLTEEMDWNSAFDMAGKSMAAVSGSNVAEAQMSMLRPFFEAIDGTIMMAVGVRDNSQPWSPDNLEVIAMIHMKQEMVNQAVEWIAKMLGQSGIITGFSDGLYRSIVGDMTLYYGNVDGYLTVSTSVPSDNHGSSLAAKFSGKQVAMSLNIPQQMFLALTGRDPGFGIEVLMTGSGSNGVYTIGLPGTDRPILQALMSL